MFLTQVQRKILPYDETELILTDICIANRDIVAFEATPKPVQAADGTLPCAVCRYKTLQPDGSFVHRSVCVKGTAEELNALRFPERVTATSSTSTATSSTTTETLSEIDATAVGTTPANTDTNTSGTAGNTSTKKRKSEVTHE